MQCDQMRELISAYADGELDAGQRREADRHLGDCSSCAQALQAITALKAAMRDQGLLYNVPGALRKKIETIVSKAADPAAHAKPKISRSILRMKYVVMASAAAVILAAGTTAVLHFWPSEQARIENEAIQDRQRSLVANHLVDMTSSDPQAALHWLSTQVNFTPVAPGRLPAGYALVGARVDMLDGRRAAVLVYRKGSMTSNLFQYPVAGAPIAGPSHESQGLGVDSWQGGGIGFVIVSDGGPDQASQISNMLISQGCGER